MEMKEKIYPILPNERETPTAPGNGHSYRLKKISDFQAFLESEVQQRDTLAKKYFRTANIVDNIDTVLITVSMVSGGGGIGLLSTIIAIPVVIALEATALVSGFVSIVGKYAVRITRSKGEKHQKIRMIADTKLNTISSHISKALQDNEI